LCVTPRVWGEIHKAFEAFRVLFKESATRKTSGKYLCAQTAYKPKDARCQAAYEPTNAIRCNDADWRRWVRVKEWFSDYRAAENINFEKEKGHIIELLKS